MPSNRNLRIKKNAKLQALRFFWFGALCFTTNARLRSQLGRTCFPHKTGKSPKTNASPLRKALTEIEKGVGPALFALLVHAARGVVFGNDVCRARRYADHRRMRLNVVQNHAARADFRARAYRYVADKLCARADENAGTHLRVPVARLVASSAEGHLVQNRNVVFHYARFARHEGRRMVEQYARSESGRRMDVHGENLAAQALEVLRQVPPVVVPQPMRHAVDIIGCI